MFSFGIAIRPSTAEILADFIIHKGWTEIIMFTDGDYCKFECFRGNYRKHGERTYELLSQNFHNILAFFAFVF